jgi:hypothetical protein
MVGPWQITDLVNPYFSSDLLKFAVAINTAGEAVHGVVGEDEFDDVFSQSMEGG